MKKLLALGIFMVLEMVTEPVVAQSNDSIMPSESTQRRIRQRACEMKRQGYSSGEIKQEAMYIARVNNTRTKGSGFMEQVTQDIEKLFVEGTVVIALTEDCP
jgi:hypothetical protein